MTGYHFGQVLLTSLYIAQFFFLSHHFKQHSSLKRGLRLKPQRPYFGGAGVKCSIVKTFLGAPCLNGWLTEKQCQSLSTGEF